jgi:hypothetical protein
VPVPRTWGFVFGIAAGGAVALVCSGLAVPPEFAGADLDHAFPQKKSRS